MYVVTNNVSSNIREVSIGVPQGSTLGPLLFILFLNDFYNCHRLHSINYADDSSVMYSSSDIDYLYRTFNTNLKTIDLWLSVNKLKLNKDKCKFMIFSNVKKENVERCIKIGNTKIKRISNIKLLGVKIDDKLNFSSHIKHVTKKLSYVSYIISRHYNLPNKILKKIYYAFGHPVIMYGISIWGGAFKVHLKHVKKVHKNLIKKISKIGNVVEAFKRENILSVENLMQYSLLCYMYKAIKLKTPAMIHESIIRNKCSIRNTRQVDQVRKPIVKLSLMKKSFTWSACTLWNNIPNDIKDKNYHNFKNCVKELLNNKFAVY